MLSTRLPDGAADGCVQPGPEQRTQSRTSPDNSAKNKAHSNTADQQSEATSDRMLTKKIRQSIVADKSLSTYGHNVKIIAKDGTVTLKGPVHSEDEKSAIASKAAEVVGSPDKVKINSQSSSSCCGAREAARKGYYMAGKNTAAFGIYAATQQPNGGGPPYCGRILQSGCLRPDGRSSGSRSSRLKRTPRRRKARPPA